MALQQSQSTSVTAKQNSSEQYVQLFEAEQNLLCQNSAPAMNAKRAEALQHFKQLGIPQRKDERYRYTDMQAIFCPRLWLKPSSYALFVPSRRGVLVRCSQFKHFSLFLNERRLRC